MKNKPHSFPLCYGGRFGANLRLMHKARYAVDRENRLTAAKALAAGVANSLCFHLQSAIQRPKRVPQKFDPVIIIGHWRSGTTLLHNLMCLDPSHTAPNTYECLFPNHFILTEKAARHWIKTPSAARNNDDMSTSLWDPQEDEIALAGRGQPSPYLSALFPNQLNLYRNYYPLDGLTPAQLRKWKVTLRRFLEDVASLRNRRLVLKNPAHSFRIPHLMELYPEARFIHLIRNPFHVFRSTDAALRAMHQSQGLHQPTFEKLHAFILERYTALHHAIETAKPQIPAGHYVEIRYEDLVENPFAQLQNIYTELNLPSAPRDAEKIEFYLQTHPRPQPKPALPESLRHTVATHWSKQIKQYGYPEVPA